MKRWTSTLVVVGLLVVAFGIAYGQHSANKEAEPTDIYGERVFTIGNNQVDGIRIESDEGIIALDRTAEGWVSIRPQELPLHNYVLEEWVDHLTEMRYFDIVERYPTNTELAAFGLDDAALVIGATLRNGSIATLRIGAPLPIPGMNYAQANDEPTVFAIVDQDVELLSLRAIDILDKRPIQFVYRDIEGLDLTWRGKAWSLNMLEDDSEDIYQSRWQLNNRRIDFFLASTVIDRARLFETKQLVRLAEEVAINNPELAMEIRYKAESERAPDSGVRQFRGQLEDDVLWVVEAGERWAYAIPLTQIEDLYKRGEDTAESRVSSDHPR